MRLVKQFTIAFRRLSIMACVVCVVAKGGQVLPAVDVNEPKELPMKLLVPAYFYPAGVGLETWNRLIDSYDPKSNVEITVIANIDSGNVGTKVDPAYADVIQRASRKGLIVIGYITSDYANMHGTAPLERAKTNVTNWLKIYPELQGIFVDEQAYDAAPIATYYQPLRKHIDSVKPGALVIGNPGNNCVEDYLAKGPTGNVMDVVIIHENNETKVPYEQALPAQWMSSYPPSRFAMLVHSSPTFARQIRLARMRQTSYVLVTDAIGPPPDSLNPWDRLPTYWGDEIQMIGAINDGLKK